MCKNLTYVINPKNLISVTVKEEKPQGQMLDECCTTWTYTESNIRSSHERERTEFLVDTCNAVIGRMMGSARFGGRPPWGAFTLSASGFGTFLSTLTSPSPRGRWLGQVSIGYLSSWATVFSLNASKQFLFCVFLIEGETIFWKNNLFIFLYW